MKRETSVRTYRQRTELQAQAVQSTHGYVGRQRCMLLRNQAVLWRELDGEAILLDPKEGCSYNLNAVGTLVWKMLDGTHTTHEIVNAVCTFYEVEYEQANQDVEQLLDDMRKNNLVARSPV